MKKGQNQATVSIMLRIRMIAGIVLTIIAIGVAFQLLSMSANNYIKAEYRDWISWPSNGPFGLLESYKTRPTRAFATWYPQISSELCGTDRRCLNLTNMVPLYGMTVFAFAFVWKFSKNLVAAATVPFIILLSSSAYVGLIWQATILDKFSGFWGLAVLLSAYWIASSKPTNIFKVIAINVGMGLIILFGLGSKEVFWPTIPAIGLLYIFMVFKHPARLRDLKYYVLPIIVTLSVSLQLISSIMDGELVDSRTVGGNLVENLSQLTRILFQLPNWIGLFILLIGIGTSIWGSLKEKEPLKRGLYAALGFILVSTIIINAKTQFNSSFYYIYSTGILACLVGLGLGFIQKTSWIGGWVMVIFLLILGYGHKIAYDKAILEFEMDNARSLQLEASMDSLLGTTCMKKGVEAVLNKPFWQGHLYLNGTWCSHKRLASKNKKLACVGDFGSHLAISTYDIEAPSYPSKYVHFNNDLKIVSKKCE